MAKMSKERKQEIEDLKAVMGTAAGRRLLHRILTYGGLGEQYQYCASPEQEGGRRMAVFIRNELYDNTPKQYLLMQQEQMESTFNRDVERKANKKEDTNVSQNEG